MRRLAWLLLVGATANAAPRCLTTTEAEAAAGPAELGARWTPPLPVSWPPAGPPAVRYFDLRSTALPTGVVRYAIDSPTVEVTVPLDGAPPRRRKLGKSTRLGTWTPPVDPPRVELEAAAALMVQLSCEARGPTEVEAAKLREGYRTWFLGEPLHRAWLSKETGSFLSWVAERPAPPPGTRLAARLDSDAVVLTRAGKEARLERPGLKNAQLFVVPLRADGSDPALWVAFDEPKTGPRGLLVAFDQPPRVLFTHVPLTRQPGVGSTSRTAYCSGI